MILTKIISSLLAVSLIVSCSGNMNGGATAAKESTDTISLAKEPSRDERLKIIRAYEDTMQASLKLDPRIGRAAMKAYLDFQRIYWRDSLCADFEFKAAEIADNMDNPTKALELYKDIYDSYTNFPYRAEALYRMANIYELKLNDYVNAKLCYEDVIHRFPGSPLAEGAKAAIQNMGKTDKELIREFEKKNGIKK